MARNFFAQSRASALTLLNVRRAERAPQKRTCATSAQGRGVPATGPERIRRREGQDAAGTDAIGAGRHRDQAKRAVAAASCPSRMKADSRWRSGGATKTAARPCQPRGPPPPLAERNDAKCAGPGSDRPRTQSHDCGAGRAQCGTVHFARECRWGGGPRTLTGTACKQERTTHAACAHLRNPLIHYAAENEELKCMSHEIMI